MEQTERQRWAQSGLQDLTTPIRCRPVDPPPGLIARLDDMTERLASASSHLGTRVDRDGVQLLAARASPGDRRQSSRHSLTGHTRLVPARDGWVAATLSRPDDIELVAALVGGERFLTDPAAAWDAVTAWCRVTDCASIVARATMLGLAFAAHAEPQDPTRDVDGLRVVTHDVDAPAVTDLSDVRVVDLSALWAGPLCSALLAEAGAHVVKVESRSRPDGARFGSPDLFVELDTNKEHVVLDFGDEADRHTLCAMISEADVVIEASRPRALAQLGVVVPGDRSRVWVSITAHGYTGAAGHRIGFGDDTAVAGGLVVALDDGPGFCADAVADPLTGLTTAVVTLELLAQGGRYHVDAAMSAIAHRFSASPSQSQ